LPDTGPVVELFRSDRTIAVHSGPVDPGVGQQLHDSPLGKAYQAVHADRSILLACGAHKKWCADPAISFATIFGEGALLTGAGADGLATGWFQSALKLDPLLEGTLLVASLQDTNQKLQLLAIANRMDLAYPAGDQWVGAEVHFVYGLVPRAGQSVATDLTVNLEFELPAFPALDATGKQLDFPHLAAKWADLPDSGDPAYAASLKAVLQQSGFSLGAGPTRIQTLKSRMNHTQDGPWRLSQLYLDRAQGQAFAPRALDGQVKQPLTQAEQKSMWKSLGAPQTTSGVAGYQVASDYQAGSYMDYRTEPPALDTPPGVCDASVDTRNVLAMQQCSWCHTGETGTGFAHVRNRLPQENAKLSGFLVGRSAATMQPDLQDIYYGNPQAVLTFPLNYKSYTGAPGCMTKLSPPFRRRGGDLAALRFATRFTE
jgi:hypothetical protein